MTTKDYLMNDVNELVANKNKIVNNLRNSIEKIFEAKSNETSTLNDVNQKLLERLKKLALERVHPNDDGFDVKLLKGRSKREKANFHNIIIEKADVVSEELLPHFKSLRNALDYQAKLLKTLRLLSHTIKFNRTLDSNIIYKFGILLFNLMLISFEITKHDKPEAILFLYNFIEIKRNLGNEDLCKGVNSDTFKALRQYQNFDQRRILHSLRKTIAFDVHLINLLNFISQAMYQEYLHIIRKDIRQNHLDLLFEVYENVLKTGRAHLNREHIAHENLNKSFIEYDSVQYSDILFAIYLLCPTLFILKEDGHLQKLKKLLSNNIFVRCGDNEISVHDKFLELINFFPNKKKIRRESKAQQIMSFSSFIKASIISNDKDNDVYHSFDSETISSKLDSFDSVLKDSSVDNFCVKDFLISIDLNGYRESLLEGKAGAFLIIQEILINFQSLYVEMKNSVSLISLKPEVCAPLSQQLLSLVQHSEIVVTASERLVNDILDIVQTRKNAKVGNHILKQLFLEVSKLYEKPDEFFKTRIGILKGILSELRMLVDREKENILSYHFSDQLVDVLDTELFRFNVNNKNDTNEYDQIVSTYLRKKLSLVLNSTVAH